MMKIDYIGPVTDGHGMSVQSRNLLKLVSTMADVKVIGFNPEAITSRLSKDEITLLMKLSSKPDRVPDVMIHYILPPLMRARADCYNICVMSWETTKIPSRDINLGNGADPASNNWAKQLKTVDEVWTFCNSSSDAIKRSGFKGKVTIIPGPIDTDFWTPYAETIGKGIIGVTHDNRGNKIEDKFVVGYVADWNERKDIDAFISCTLLALPPANSVVVLKSRDYLGKQKISDIARKLKDRLLIPQLPQLVIIDEDLSPEEMRGLFQSFDVYACTSRGEGLNLPALQAMSMCKHVVLPAHSAHTDYIEQGRNGDLIATNLEICRTMVKNPWYQNDQVWGKVNEVQYLQCIQKLHKTWAAGKLKKNDEARKTVVNKYSVESCTKLISSRLNAIRAGVGDQGRDTNGKS